MNDIQQVKFKNGYFVVMGEALNYPMTIANRKVKRRFQTYVKTQGELYDAARKELCETHCDKKDGKPVIENGHYIFSPENQQEFNKEYGKLLEEVVSLDVLPGQALDFIAIKELLDKSPVELNDLQTNYIMEALDVLATIKIPSPYNEPKEE